jgi:hypothetical protein
MDFKEELRVIYNTDVSSRTRAHDLVLGTEAAIRWGCKPPKRELLWYLNPGKADAARAILRLAHTITQSCMNLDRVRSGNLAVEECIRRWLVYREMQPNQLVSMSESDQFEAMERGFEDLRRVSVWNWMIFGRRHVPHDQPVPEEGLSDWPPWIRLHQRPKL